MKLSKLWQVWLVVTSILWLLPACGAESVPASNAAAGPPTTVAPTATVRTQDDPVATAMATVPPSVSILPTATSTPFAESPVLTTTQILTSADAITTVAASGQEPLVCTAETDIALASYPELQTLMGCALGPAIFDPVAINEFGEGPDFDRFMLWFSHELQIYVLRPDKSWQVYGDTWTEDEPTFACNPLGGEATSPPLPRRGFGKLWCQEQELQTVMGTVAKEERLCQHTVLQSFDQGRLLACYEDATIRYIRIMDDGSWDQVLVR